MVWQCGLGINGFGTLNSAMRNRDMHETPLSNEKVPVFVRKLAVFRVEPVVFRGLLFTEIQHNRKLAVRYENGLMFVKSA